ncbi:hypothetical protein J1N35_024572 [Gossypium stocksii]|uniref:Uncharacterized protein n=1 Tax=Gossypium stocksii TaxID=47602 RepID=A0A9D3ZWZ6_9ROSI|nr:hypothetical protein J1N35_024572 [Gossypium stocksii]
MGGKLCLVKVIAFLVFVLSILVIFKTDDAVMAAQSTSARGLKLGTLKGEMKGSWSLHGGPSSSGPGHKSCKPPSQGCP